MQTIFEFIVAIGGAFSFILVGIAIAIAITNIIKIICKIKGGTQ